MLSNLYKHISIIRPRFAKIAVYSRVPFAASGSFSSSSSNVPILVTIITSEQERFTLHAKEEESVKDLVDRTPDLKRHIECACEGMAACSTCHVIVDDKDQFDALNPIEEAEADLVDLASHACETSRLGCQIKFKVVNDGIVLRIPNEVVNFYR